MSDPNETTQARAERLVADGWKEWPDQFRDYARCFFKRFDTPTRCHGNSDKHGIQVCVAISSHKEWHSYEIDLAGELADGTWIKLHAWAMPPKLEDGLATIPRLLAAWENLNQDKP